MTRPRTGRPRDARADAAAVRRALARLLDLLAEHVASRLRQHPPDPQPPRPSRHRRKGGRPR
jgi:hypothetical protein